MCDTHHNRETNHETVPNRVSVNSPLGLEAGMSVGEYHDYRLENFLGKGAYGEVWLASHTVGQATQQIACKFLRYSKNTDQRKEQEQKVIEIFERVHDLEHKNICQIHNLIWDHELGFFYTMVPANNGTLGSWFKRQPNYEKGLPVFEFVEHLSQVAMALDYVHKKRIVHRDVKPENILLTKDPDDSIVPLLSDFGISIQIRDSITHTTNFFGQTGSLLFMAPEQCCPDPVLDGRTDQYALGVIAYLFLSGHYPYRIDNHIVLEQQILEADPLPIENVPVNVNKVLLRALAKRKEDRFDSCGEFINSLYISSVKPTVIIKSTPAHSNIIKPKSNSPKNIVFPGKYKTLEEACEEAPEGSVITIKPGKYTLENEIELSQSITLCSKTGNAEDVTIDCQKSTTFVITDGSPSFKNLTVRNSNKNGYAFYVIGGTPQIFSCIITAPQSDGICVEGEEANPIVEKCVIKGCKIAGVIVCEGGLGKFNNCEICENEVSGITVMDSGNPTVIKCKIHNAGYGGIGVFNSGLGEFTNCEIYGNQGPGIQTAESGNPTFIQCNIHDGNNFGVLIRSNGLGLFLNCKIFKNDRAGIVVNESGNPFFARCMIHNEKGYGLLVQSDGKGQFWDCEIYRNKLVGILVIKKGDPTIVKAKIHHGKEAGVAVSENGLGKFHQCDIYENKGPGIIVTESGNPTVTSCNIHDGKLSGVFILDEGKGTFNNNTLSNNYADKQILDWFINNDAGKVKGSGNTPKIPKKWKVN